MRSLNCRRWALVLIYLRPKKNFYRRCLIALYVQVSVQSPKEIKASRDVFLCRKCLHQWMFGLGVAMIFGPRVTCKVSSTSPSQWNPRCMSSWLIISTPRLWLRPSGGCFEDNVSIKTATLPGICICHCLRVARSPKMWAAILFGKDFPSILNTRESPFLTRIFSATLPVVFGASTTRTREEAIDYVTWTPAETAYGGFSFTNSWLQKTNKKWFVKCLWSQKSMIYIYYTYIYISI